MKKVIIVTACMLFVSGMAFAGNTVTLTLTSKDTTGGSLHADSTSGGAGAGTALIGKNSTGVGTGVRTNVNGYAMITQHLNGSKVYGSSYDSTSIFSEDVTTEGTAMLSGVPNATDTSDFTSWDEL